MEAELLGYVDVDSGSMWIGDPCYIIKDSDEGRPKDLGENWADVCDKFFERANQHKHFANFTHDGGHGGMGIMTNTFHGDGSYPVYAERDSRTGRIKRLIIDFDPSEDE